MKHLGPVRPNLTPRPSGRWRPIVLTLMCAGGMAIIIWLTNHKTISSRTVTIATVIVVPIATFILAADGPRAFFHPFLRRRRPRIPRRKSSR